MFDRLKLQLEDKQKVVLLGTVNYVLEKIDGYYDVRGGSMMRFSTLEDALAWIVFEVGIFPPF